MYPGEEGAQATRQNRDGDVRMNAVGRPVGHRSHLQTALYRPPDFFHPLLLFVAQRHVFSRERVIVAIHHELAVEALQYLRRRPVYRRVGTDGKRTGGGFRRIDREAHCRRGAGIVGRAAAVADGEAVRAKTRLARTIRGASPKPAIESQTNVTDASLPPLTESFDYPLIVAV